ncbi:MAG: ABC transporter permease [Rhodospirillaceae bacterium]|nr:MAG: ABC transporter permease [Rhodospirillaceae bacterium]
MSNTTTNVASTASSDNNKRGAAILTKEEARFARRELRRHKMTAFALVVPLLVFISFAFVAPILTMLHQGYYSPVVADLIPQTLEKLESWDGQGQPDKRVLTSMAIDLKRLAADRTSGKLAAEINRHKPGASSMVKSTARKLRRKDDADLAQNGAALLLAANKSWADAKTWQAVQKAGKIYTDGFYLTALDLERTFEGEIQIREATQIYIQLYTKTLRMALVITLMCLVLGYPLAYFLANAPSKTSNMLMIFVLLPFWTSLLVRTTAWIALLQTNGVVNSFLMELHVISEPLDMLYTEFSTIIAMTHILLPFMILPLYSVMKGIDKSYMRAAMSMGAKPIPAFLKVYLPNTLPGLSAGALLVFIISVGYYITPALVGGTDGQMISNIIAFHMQQSNNWGLAAALGTMLLILILTLYWVYDRFVGASNIKLG